MSKTIDDCVVRHISIESEEDFEETCGEYYLDVDIGDRATVCDEADVWMREDDKSWSIYHSGERVDCIAKTINDTEEDREEKMKTAHELFRQYCNASLAGEFDKERKPYDPSFDYSNPSDIFKQMGEATIRRVKQKKREKVEDEIEAFNEPKKMYCFYSEDPIQDNDAAILGWVRQEMCTPSEKRSFADMVADKTDLDLIHMNNGLVQKNDDSLHDKDWTWSGVLQN